MENQQFGPPAGTAPMYPGGHHPGLPSHPTPQPSKGLAIASMVLGIVALLGCLIPGVNLVSIALALVGLVLGVVALVKRLGGRGMAIAGLITSALAVVGAIVANLLFGAAVSSALDGVASASQSASSTGDTPAASPDGAASEPATKEDSAQPLGTPGTVGDYTVTVTSVNTNANAVVAEANQFNEPPKGQYVVAELSVTYNGDSKGTPWIDLSSDFLGADARDYDTASCSLGDSDEVSQPDLRKGGTTTYSVCFDVPAEAVQGSRVSIEEGLSLNSKPVIWAVS